MPKISCKKIKFDDINKICKVELQSPNSKFQCPFACSLHTVLFSYCFSLKIELISSFIYRNNYINTKFLSFVKCFSEIFLIVRNNFQWNTFCLPKYYANTFAHIVRIPKILQHMKCMLKVSWVFKSAFHVEYLHLTLLKCYIETRFSN